MDKKASRVCTVLLRLIAVAATLTATIIIVLSHDSITIFGITMEAKFQYTPSLVFFVIINVIAAVYTLITLFVIVPSSSPLSRPIVVLDLMIAMLLVGAYAAAVAVGEVGRKGNKHAGWVPICGLVQKFCGRVTIAMLCGFISIGVYFIIMLHTILTVLHPLGS